MFQTATYNPVRNLNKNLLPPPRKNLNKSSSFINKNFYPELLYLSLIKTRAFQFMMSFQEFSMNPRNLIRNLNFCVISVPLSKAKGLLLWEKRGFIVAISPWNDNKGTFLRMIERGKKIKRNNKYRSLNSLKKSKRR